MRFVGASLGGEAAIRSILKILLGKTVMAREIILLMETAQDYFGRVARRAHQMGLEGFKITMS